VAESCIRPGNPRDMWEETEGGEVREGRNRSKSLIMDSWRVNFSYFQRRLRRKYFANLPVMCLCRSPVTFGARANEGQKEIRRPSSTHRVRPDSKPDAVRGFGSLGTDAIRGARPSRESISAATSLASDPARALAMSERPGVARGQHREPRSARAN
jgi:hypothetical protein